jgi:hypothetical protein
MSATPRQWCGLPSKKRFAVKLAWRRRSTIAARVNRSMSRFVSANRLRVACGIECLVSWSRNVASGSVPPVRHHDKLTLAPLPASVGAAAY